MRGTYVILARFDALLISNVYNLTKNPVNDRILDTVKSYHVFLHCSIGIRT